MGGDITVSSRVSQGRRFNALLPAWERDRPATTRSAPSHTTERSLPRLPLTGARFAGSRSARVALGELLVATAPTSSRRSSTGFAVIRSFRARGRSSRAELEDHIATYLSDMGQMFAILDERSAERLPLIEDGTIIQRVIAERHGAQRHRLGWTEEELRASTRRSCRKWRRVVLDSSLLTGSPPSDTLPLLRVMLHEATELTIRGWFTEADAAQRAGRERQADHRHRTAGSARQLTSGATSPSSTAKRVRPATL
jgi:hypothetical protein